MEIWLTFMAERNWTNNKWQILVTFRNYTISKANDSTSKMLWVSSKEICMAKFSLKPHREAPQTLKAAKSIKRVIWVIKMEMWSILKAQLFGKPKILRVESSWRFSLLLSLIDQVSREILKLINLVRTLIINYEKLTRKATWLTVIAMLLTSKVS